MMNVTAYISIDVPAVFFLLLFQLLTQGIVRTCDHEIICKLKIANTCIESNQEKIHMLRKSFLFAKLKRDA